MNQITRVRASLIFGIALLSLTGLCIKNATSLTDQNLMGIVGIRSALALVLWFIFFRINGWSIKSILMPTKLQFLAGLLFAISNITFIYSTMLTTAHNAVFLQYMNPLWIAIFLWAFLGKPIARYDNIALPLLAAGTLLLVWEGLSFDSALGTGLGVICGMSYAVLLILLSKEKSSFLRLKTLFIGNILAVLLASPWAFEMSSSTQINWLWVVALGVLAFGLPWIILTKVLQEIPPLEFAVLSMIGPVLNSVWVFLFPPHEVPGFIACLGALVILLGIGYRVYAQSPKRSQ